MSGRIVNEPCCQSRGFAGCGAAQLVIAIALIIICGIGASMHWGIPAIASTGAVGGLFIITAIMTFIKACKRPSGRSIAEGVQTTPRNIIPVTSTTTTPKPTTASPIKRTLPEAALKNLENWTAVTDYVAMNTRNEAAARIRKCYEEKSTSLDLSNLNLSSLPDVIKELTHLERLNLSGNRLDLFKGMGLLDRLRFLDLSNNDFTEFPEAIFELDKLHSLNLSQNRIIFLHGDIGQMSDLRLLDLRNNRLKTITGQTVFQMHRLSEALRIDLSDNNLDENTQNLLNDPGPYDPHGPTFVFEGAVKKNEKGKEAAPVDNEKEKGVAGKKAVPHPPPTNFDGLKNWVKEAPENERKARDAAAQRIQNCFNSKSLDLQLRGLSLTSLPPEIGALNHLNELDLSRNSLTALPPEIGNLSCLKELLLSDNGLTEFPEALCHLHDLRRLNMERNQIVSLPPQINRISNLRVLCLGDNKIASISDETLDQLKRLSSKLGIYLTSNPVWDNLEKRQKLKDFKTPTTLSFKDAYNS